MVADPIQNSVTISSPNYTKTDQLFEPRILIVRFLYDVLYDKDYKAALNIRS